MREIKFRCYSQNGGGLMYNFDLETMTLFYKDDVVMEYIGIKDKNGVKIYEGDICLIKNFHNYEGEEIGYVLVKYDNEECKYIVENEETEIGFEDIYSADIEVVGNICENPELLEQNNEND